MSSESLEAGALAVEMFNKGSSLDEVIVELSVQFSDYNFYESNKHLYMQHDEGHGQPIDLCNVPEQIKICSCDVLEYAANMIECDAQRGNFVKGFVEEQAWAVAEITNWMKEKLN